MRILTDEEDQQLRERVRSEIGFHHEPSEGWEPVEMEDSFIVPWPGNDKSPRYREAAIDVIGEISDKFYVLIFETDQYVPRFQETFNDKYNGNCLEASPEELKEILDDLIIVYAVSKDMNWIVLFDHDGGLNFSGEIKEKAKQEFEEIDK